MCTECTLAFFLSPLKAGIVAFSFAVAIATFVMLRRLKAASPRKRLSLLYVHVFAFVFPFLFFMFFKGCQSYFSGCDQAKAVLTMLGLTAAIATMLALILAPFVFVKKQAGRARLLKGGYWNSFAQRHLARGKTVKLHILNTAAPVAFSFSLFTPKIFLSAGLFDMLQKKEIEAVLLHELAHVAGRASVLRLSHHLARLLSPFAALASFQNGSGIDEDEKTADSYAVEVQGTSKYLKSAKEKIISYSEERARLFP